GSEVTPYSVLTVPEMRTKKSFASQWAFPKVAFADPAYTESLPYGITLDTAFDAFSHLLESYYSRRSTPLNDAVALEGIKAFAECMDALASGDIDYGIREKLMYASCLGGIAITHTGTTLIHAMGYSLTHLKGYTHGRANAMLTAGYMRFNEKAVPEKSRKVLQLLGLEDFGSVDDYFSLGQDGKPILSDDEISDFTKLAMGQGSVRTNPRTVGEEDAVELYRSIFGGNG
ncbi:MAG: iron-containing alcohol dehydrogenase, partial [Clostridia bacterium]|nr:iron-containing alcohol dehydrogenase [Clostridia bacterium]